MRKDNIEKLTSFERAVYEILNHKHISYVSGTYSTQASTKQEIMASLKVHYGLPQKDDRHIRKAISSMRKKGMSVGAVQPCGYGILSDIEMRIQRSELLSRVKELVKGIKGIEACLGVADGQVTLEEIING